MKPSIWLFCGVILLVTPQTLLAQRRGSHGAGGGRGPTGVSQSDDMKSFERTVALQATPEQVAQFQRLSASTGAARKSAQDFLQLSASSGNPELTHYADPLSDALEEAQSENDKFLQSFSKEQQSGLKKIAKKLRKADSEITSQSKALSQQLERGGTAGKQVGAIAEKLDKALSDFQSGQLAIATEMGIQGQGISE